MQALVWHTRSFSQLNKGHLLPEELNDPIGALVAALGLWAGPSAILWLVVAVHVDAVQRHPSRPISHIN
jgi:hypothetical protein